ncbi:hypothetical protein CRI94_15635 [Longibacter salinarum]|uniref:Uncharacterized protein n=1 Tax=Longibacter salinarum TaxID=1850348 RepID=A0A2A8CUN0_9BACT|nr:DUF5995 family protein [Longibacter salinarum]PEN11463.1 hypothetical protein CRI94_15635 [Longibacter salinarum]
MSGFDPLSPANDDRMLFDDATLLGRMQSHVESWMATGDVRAVFLECYLIMTRNMVAQVHADAFGDARWVHGLLHRFAEYYFDALSAYESEGMSPPAVWQVAFDCSASGEATAVQHLLLGVNAHINYDLVLTLEDILAPEWSQLDRGHQAIRYADHCSVNRVIAQSVDAVQDTVLEPRMQFLEFVDIALGPVDEYLVSRLITSWREDVWRHTQELLRCRDERERRAYVATVEAEALRIAEWMV